ncbi:unnamed protein product, partial [marine sediment metagenome]
MWLFFGLAIEIITSLALSIGIPPFILGITIGLIGISALFAVIYLIFRWK